MAFPNPSVIPISIGTVLVHRYVAMKSSLSELTCVVCIGRLSLRREFALQYRLEPDERIF